MPLNPLHATPFSGHAATLSLAAVDGHKTKSSLTAMLCPGFELTSVKVTVTEKRS